MLLQILQRESAQKGRSKARFPKTRAIGSTVR